MPETDLARKMVARAQADHLPVDHELRLLAAAFETAAMGYFATVQTHTVRQFMAAYARARVAWCAYSGESLV